MKKYNYIASAKRTLKIESDSISQIASQLDESFTLLCQKIISSKGKFVTMGVGKSGHIAQKISSTLSSTGTPSIFIHPTEGAHGDIGLIEKKDMVLLISNSGETSEMRDIVAHTRRFSIPMAAISSNSDSTLTHAADFKLVLPDAAEACAIGMAPTTSTTMTLALGDALAVTLMHERNFNSESFQIGKASKTSFIWILILVSAVFLSNFFTNPGLDEIEVQYSQYRSFLNKGLISKAQIVDEVFHGELAQEQNIINKRGSSIDVKRFRLKLPFIDRDVMNEWDKNGVDYSFKPVSYTHLTLPTKRIV